MATFFVATSGDDSVAERWQKSHRLPTFPEGTRMLAPYTVAWCSRLPLSAQVINTPQLAQALKIHTVISGKTLTLSDLGAFEGKCVQVTVQEELERDVEQATHRPRRELGLLRGKVWLAEDLDAPLPDDIQKYFDGNAD